MAHNSDLKKWNQWSEMENTAPHQRPKTVALRSNFAWGQFETKNQSLTVTVTLGEGRSGTAFVAS